MMSATTDLNLLNALIQSLHAQRLDVQAARMIVEVSVVHGAYNRVSTTLTHPRFSNMFRFSRPRIFSCVWSRALMVAFSEARDTAAHGQSIFTRPLPGRQWQLHRAGHTIWKPVP